MLTEGGSQATLGTLQTGPYSALFIRDFARFVNSTIISGGGKYSAKGL